MIKHCFSLLSSFLLVILMVCSTVAQPTINITPEVTTLNIGDKIYVLEDKIGKITFQEIRQPSIQEQFRPHYQQVPVFGIKPQLAVWSKFKYHNQSDEDTYLEVQIPYLDTVRLFVIDGIGKLHKYEAGDTKKFTDRQLLIPSFTFKLPKGQGTCFLYVSSPSGLNQFPLQLVKISTLFRQQAIKNLSIGLYFGFVIIIVFYNLFLGIKLKEVVYFYYIGFIMATGLTVAQLNGYLFQYFFPQYPIFNYYENLIYALNFLPGLFITEFLELKKRLPRALYGLYLFYMLYWGAAFITLLGYPAWGTLVIQITAISNAFYVIGLSLHLYSTGYILAKMLLYAWLGYLVGTIALVGQFLDLLPYNIFTANALQIGSTVEIILLSWAVAEKINLLKQEKEQTQADFVEALQANAKFVAEQNIALETKVRERTKELAVKNEELKQNQEEILTQKDFIYQQNLYLKQKDERLTNSIQAATQIQQSILPSEEALNTLLKEYFLLYLPKDVVSGDFYAVYWVVDRLMVVVADCTGHGVPGAFMTLVGKTLLDKIIEQHEITSPADILQQLHLEINATLHQAIGQTDQGMDIAICSIREMHNNQVEVIYGSAKRPLFYYKKSENLLLEQRGNRHSIGGIRKKQPIFDNHTILLETGDILYLCSDGFIDQNNEERNSFGVSRFKSLIATHAHQPLALQKQFYYRQLQQYQYGTEQRDDILVLGFKL